MVWSAYHKGHKKGVVTEAGDMAMEMFLSCYKFEQLGSHITGGQSCKNVRTVRTSRCYFFVAGANYWEKHVKNRQKQAKTRENTRKQAKNRRFFGANFFGGKIGWC